MPGVAGDPRRRRTRSDTSSPRRSKKLTCITAKKVAFDYQVGISARAKAVELLEKVRRFIDAL